MKYPPNAYCVWQINPPASGTNNVTIQIGRLEIEEEDGNCPYDFLSFTDGGSTELARYGIIFL